MAVPGFRHSKVMEPETRLVLQLKAADESKLMQRKKVTQLEHKDDKKLSKNGDS